jgi:cell wall-associated NlpC family hydrolase
VTVADDAAQAAARRVQAFTDRLVIDGSRLDADIRGRVTGARTVRTMDGASSLVLTVDDNDRSILRSGILSKAGSPTKRGRKAGLQEAAWDRVAAARLTLDGWFTRLAGYDFNIAARGTTLELTFEDEIAWLMRRQRAAIVSSRSSKGHPGGEMTRAEFIAMLLQISTKKQVGYVHYFSPEQSVQQQVRKPSKTENQNLEKGFADGEVKHLTIQAAPINSGQRRNLTIALTEADDLHAGERAATAMLASGIGESGWQDIMNSSRQPVEQFKKSPAGRTSGYGGVLQGRVATSLTPNWFRDMGSEQRTREEARSFLQGGRGYNGGGAIKLAADNPDWSPGLIALTVEGSRANFSSDAAAEAHYQQHAVEAAAILDAWGGSSQIVTRVERYSYRAGGKRDGTQHNYWDDAGDLVDEVNWRLYADANTLYDVNDEWLLTRQPVYQIDEQSLTGGILSIEATADDSASYLSEITVQALAPAWQRTPGAVVLITGDFGPLAGRWLTWEDDHDRATDQATITLHRPEPKLKEPESKRSASALTESSPDAGTARDRIVKAARKAIALDKKTDYLHYAEVRPMPGSLFPRGSETATGIYTGPVIVTDCSGFATLCYKAAQQADPNGLNYNGQGYTGTLAANGTRTSDPQPGDLGFFGAGPPWDHVVIYLGGGKVASHGNPRSPNPREFDATDFGTPHWYAYQLDDS